MSEKTALKWCKTNLIQSTFPPSEFNLVHYYVEVMWEVLCGDWKQGRAYPRPYWATAYMKRGKTGTAGWPLLATKWVIK